MKLHNNLTTFISKNHNCCLYFILLFSFFINNPSFGQAQVNSFSIQPKPSWVKNYPMPKLEEEYDLDLVLLHTETQYNHIRKEIYFHHYYYLNNIDGVNEIRSFSSSFEPDYQSIQINIVNIHRGKETIPQDKQLHTEYRFKGKQIKGKRYDDDATVMIFFEKVRVGDIIEIGYTKIGSQPDMHGQLLFHNYIDDKSLRGYDYSRVISSKDKPIHYKLINLDLQPIKENTDKFFSIEFTIKNDKELSSINSPSWYSNDYHIYCFDNNSWIDEVNRNFKNFELDNPPSDNVKRKVNKLIKGLNSQTDKIDAILNYTQKDIHYLSYGLYDPKKPNTVLEQGFGDCKSKSLLTIKMLECLNVKAWPLLVNSDGLGERYLDLYNGQIFDHCVIEFLYNSDTIVFDPTMVPQNGSIDQKFISNFRYGLRIKEGEQNLSKLKWKTSNSLNLTTSIYKKDKDDWEAYMDSKITFEGQLANENNFLFQEEGIRRVFNTVSNNYFWEYLYHNHFEYEYSYNENKPYSILDLKSKSPYLSFTKKYDKPTFFKPYPLYKWLKVPNPDKLGPFFSLPDYKSINHLFKLEKLDWMRFTPDSTSFENDWVKYKKLTWVEKDTIYASYSTEFLKTSLDSSRHNDVSETIDYLKEDMSLLLAPKNEDSNDRQYIKYVVYAVLLIFVGVIFFTIRYFIIKRRKNITLIKELQTELSEVKKELENNSINQN